jgi:hypothetical protein
MCAVKHISPELSDVNKHIDVPHWARTTKNKRLLDKLRVATKLVVTTYSEGVPKHRNHITLIYNPYFFNTKHVCS